MRDPITDAAQDPSCLLCLTPDRGGSWWSRLRPPTPRVFSTSAYWPGFVSAFNSNGIKNYRFSIRFSLSEMPSRDRVLFGNQMALGEGRFMLVLSSKGEIQVQDESAWSGMVKHPISGTGKHTVMIEIAESSGRIMIDGVEYAVSVSRTAPILTIAFSNFPGTISSILLESDSGTLWQAAYSDLYAIYEPRNFADNPMTFTDSYTAQDGIGTDDFTLSVDFTLLRKNVPGTINIGCMQCSYYDSTKGHQPCVRILKSDGTKDALYPVGTSHILENVASIKVIKTGQNVRMVVYARDGSTIKEGTAAIPDGATVTYLSGATNYPGNIFAASIRNDTTGTDVWQAAHSNLYTLLPPPPWPSPVPENFAENARAFYDCQAVMQEALDPTHDYKFLFDFEITKDEGEASVFYAGAPNFPFGVYVYSDNTVRVFSNLLQPPNTTSSKYTTTIVYSGDTRLQGRHVIELNIEGDTMRSFLDGSEIAQQYKTVRTGTAAVGLPNCNSGYVYKIQITDLTDNQVVWSYPSEAERVRLITKTNVRTDRGYFEQANTKVNSYVNTALDLRGRVSSYTVFIDFYPAVFPESNNAECHQELAGQGGALIGSGFPPICSVGYYKTVDQTYRLQFAQQSGSLRRTVNVTLAAALSGRCRIVGVVDVQSSSTTLTLYLDGEQIGTSTYSGIPDGTAASIARCFSVAGVKEYGGWINYTGKVYSCLLFDRALSAAEIAALTPKQA